MRSLALGAAASIGLVLAGAAMAQPGKIDSAAIEKLPSVKELPDPFVMNDGSRVKTKADWASRREELRELVQKYEYGHLPPRPKSVHAKLISSQELPAIGAVEKQFVLYMTPDEKVSSHLVITTPKGDGPFPVIITGDLGWGLIKDPIVADVIKRGYMLAQFSRIEVAPDGKDFRDYGVFTEYPDCDGACLAAWAWGYHRVIDYLETQNNVDKKHFAVTGHSRGGKAALLAGAMDERIALTNPNNSGCGGAGCYRFQAQKSEDIAAITKNFPFWFVVGFRDFIGKEDRLPIDQHSVKALVAPRALLSTEALGDLWANPEGTQATYLAAKVVYDWLGAGDKIGIYDREGGHQQGQADWQVLLDYADQVFFGKKSDRKFDQLAFPDSPKQFSWKAPR